MNDEVTSLLAAVRPAQFHPGTAVDPATRERELTAAFTARPAAGRARHGSRPPARRLMGRYGIGLAATAAATAAAVAVTMANPAPAPSNTRPSNARPSNARPSNTGPGSARQILLAAALSAAKAPALSGAYWLTDDVSGVTYQVNGSGGQYQVNQATEEKDWDANTPARSPSAIKSGNVPSITHYWADRNLGTQPAGAASTAAWQRSGSPTSWAVTGTHSRTTLRTHSTGWTVDQEQTDMPIPFQYGSLKQLQQLPTTASGLRAYLLASNSTCAHGCEDAPEWQVLFDQAINLAGEPVPPLVLAAIYRMAAQIPGIHAVGWVTDPLGRRGYAVALNVQDGTEQLVFQPATGTLLAEELITPADRANLLRPGTQGQPRETMSWVATRQADWTNTEPQHADFTFNGTKMVRNTPGSNG
jgi:hypothetical protein